MMRQPTPLRAAYAWHIAAMAGADMPMHDGLPECGWFRMRMVKGGPWVAVEIRLQREIDDAGKLTGPERLVATVNGEAKDPSRLWTYLTPISREDFNALIQRQADPRNGMQATHVRMDLSREPIRP